MLSSETVPGERYSPGSLRAAVAGTALCTGVGVIRRRGFVDGVRHVGGVVYPPFVA